MQKLLKKFSVSGGLEELEGSKITELILRTGKGDRYKLRAKDLHVLAVILQRKKVAARLKSLDISNNDVLFGDDGCSVLAPALLGLKRLFNLGLSNNAIGDEGCAALCPALLCQKKLRMLVLSNNMIGEKGCAHLSLVICSKPTFFSLQLGNNQISPQGIAFLKNLFGQRGCLIF